MLTGRPQRRWFEPDFFICSNDCNLFQLCSAGSWYFVVSECAPLRIWTVFDRITLLLISLLEKHPASSDFGWLNGWTAWWAVLFCLFPAGCLTPTTSNTTTTTTTTTTTEQTTAESNCSGSCNSMYLCCLENPPGHFMCRIRPGFGNRMYFSICLFNAYHLSVCLSTSLSVYQLVFPSVPMYFRLADSVSS